MLYVKYTSEGVCIELQSRTIAATKTDEPACLHACLMMYVANDEYVQASCFVDVGLFVQF